MKGLPIQVCKITNQNKNVSASVKPSVQDGVKKEV